MNLISLCVILATEADHRSSPCKAPWISPQTSSATHLEEEESHSIFFKNTQALLTLMSLLLILEHPLKTRWISLLNNGLRVARHHHGIVPG